MDFNYNNKVIKAIFFDLDGTLIDSESYYIENTYILLKKLGFKGSKQEVLSIVGTNMEKTYDILEKLLEYKIDRETIIKENTYHFECFNPIDYQKLIFKEVIEILLKLKQENYKLALCSLSERKLVTKFLNENKLTDVFDFVLSSDDVLEAKPNPEIYLRALDYFNLKNDEAIVFEDSYIGILAAKNANIYTLARKSKDFEIDQSMADRVIGNMQELYEIVWSKNNE